MRVSRHLSYEKAAEIAQQQYFDFLKHITTLDTGTILLVSGLLEKVFVNPKWKLLIVCSFVFLILSIVGAVFTMLFQSFVFQDDDTVVEFGSFAVVLYVVWFMAALLGFILGLLSFVVFAIRNLF